MQDFSVLMAGIDPEEKRQIKQTLEEAGYIPEAFWEGDSSEQVFSLFKEHTPALIFLGLCLKDITYLDFLRYVTDLGFNRECRIILVAPQQRIVNSELRQAMDLGLDDLLLGPWQQDELKMRLEFILGRVQQPGSQLRFKQLAARAGLGCWEYDVQQDRFYGSQALYAMLGYFQESEYRGEELLQQHFFAADVQSLKQIMQNLVPGQGFEVEMLCRRLDQEERSIKIQGQKDPRTDISLVTGIFQDVTQQKRVENKLMQLLEQSSLQAAALEQSGEGIVLTDQDFRVIYVNPFFDQTSGFSASELINRLQQKIYRHAHTQQVDQEEGHAGQIWRGQLKLEDKHGAQRQVEITASPVRDKAGHLANYVFLVRDITEKMHLQQQLQQAQKMEAIGTLAGGIAHDFNNMLMGIQGFTELALSKLDTETQAARHLQNVLQTSRRAKDLVQQILTFSRQQDADKKPLQVSTVVKEVSKLLQATLPANIDLETSIEPECPLILADPTQIQQVIMNLCTNALQAMPSGGKLRVSLKGLSVGSADPCKPEGVAPGNYLLLQVEDSGEGMEQVLVERIFDPFFTTKSREQGTGLGLSVVHGILQELAGSVSVQTSLGQGTMFSVYLPAVQEISSWHCKRDAQAAAIVKGKGNILFVDDQQEIVHWGVRALEGLGYRVFGTSDSLRAWELLRNNAADFDLVVTDLSMPGLSGLEFLQNIKELSPALPVILCTGYSEGEAESTEAVQQADALLYKPFSMSEFSRLVSSLIQKGPVFQE